MQTHKFAIASLTAIVATMIATQATGTPVAPATPVVPKTTPAPVGPKSVANKFVHFEAGTSSWPELSGYGGTGMTRTAGPKNDTDLVGAVHGLVMSEMFDDPSTATIEAKRLDTLAEAPEGWNLEVHLPVPDNYTNNKDKKEVVFTARRFVRGVQVCTGNEKDSDDRKIKGVRLYYATVKTDGTVENDDTNGTAWERPNCKDWQAARYCPSNKVTRSMKFHANSKNKWFQGVQLECMKPSFY